MWTLKHKFLFTLLQKGNKIWMKRLNELVSKEEEEKKNYTQMNEYSGGLKKHDKLNSAIKKEKKSVNIRKKTI